MQKHVARGADLEKKGLYALAEQEYRVALLFDSQDDNLYMSLAHVLIEQKRWDDATTAVREAVHLNPNNANAHVFLSLTLGQKGDLDGEIAEYRELVRLNPNNDLAHERLGFAHVKKGAWLEAVSKPSVRRS